MEKKIKEFFAFVIFLAVLILTISFIIIISPEELVNKIGIQNTYFIIFFVALITGVSALTGVYFYALLIAFAIGGSNIILLGIFSGIGLTLSDWLFFYLGKKSRHIISSKHLLKIDKFTHYVEHKSNWFVPTFVVFYTSLTPFPTDILTMSIGFLSIPFKRIIIPLLIGNIVSTILVCYLTIQGSGVLF